MAWLSRGSLMASPAFIVSCSTKKSRHMRLLLEYPPQLRINLHTRAGSSCYCRSASPVSRSGSLLGTNPFYLCGPIPGSSSGSPGRMTCRGLPATKLPGATFRCTTAPAATTALSPIVTPGRIVLLAPIIT